MTAAKKRFAIGGAGALMPILIAVVSIDIAVVAEYPLEPGEAAGILLRYIILFVIGGFVAWLHEDEDKPYKLFQIGIAAPALLTSLATGGITLPDGQRAPYQPMATISFSVIGSAWAADAEHACTNDKERSNCSHHEPGTTPRRDDERPKSSFFSNLLRGITGATYSDIRKNRRYKQTSPPSR